jgi:hypothetical protein
VSAAEFQEILMTHSGLSEDIALDFTEQLMIFEKCGNVYASDEFVQARDVSHHLVPFIRRNYLTKRQHRFLV